MKLTVALAVVALLGVAFVDATYTGKFVTHVGMSGSCAGPDDYGQLRVIDGRPQVCRP